MMTGATKDRIPPEVADSSFIIHHPTLCLAPSPSHAPNPT